MRDKVSQATLALAKAYTDEHGGGGGGGTTIVQIPSVSGTSFTYDGTAQGAAITGLDNTHCTVVPGTGTTVTTVGDTTYVKATNAGSYSFSVELNDTSSMVWSDLTTADKTYSYTIAKASQTITASKNSVSLTAQQTSDTVTISGQQGSLNVSSSDTGIATVSESSGVVTITAVGNGSATVSVYAEETANYTQSATVSISVASAIAPDGKTVTPTDDIQTWLHCANIWDKTYTTINQVLADNTTLLALISSNNAVDYMARSTTWASSVCDSSIAMADIGSNNYCKNTLLADSTWVDAIGNSTYVESVLNIKIPTMTSDTSDGVASGSTSHYGDWYQVFDGNASTLWLAQEGNADRYIQYQFTSAMKANRITFSVQTRGIAKAKLQGSNNGSNWTDIVDIGAIAGVSSGTNTKAVNFVNSTAYQYFRVIGTADNTLDGRYFFGCSDMQIYGRA